MSQIHPRIAVELRIVSRMISIYCAKKHGGESLCSDCSELLSEAGERLIGCPYAGEKPTCRSCETHCWSGGCRDRIRDVMRFSGPRMVIHHPIDALVHMIHEFSIGRILATGIGWISLLLGIIGIAVPGLPTVPFVLLSAFLFSQSSPRFHSWIRSHRYFGSIISTWERDRAIPKGMKEKAIAITLCTMSVSIVVIPVIHAKLFLAIIAVAVTVFLVRIREVS